MSKQTFANPFDFMMQDEQVKINQPIVNPLAKPEKIKPPNNNINITFSPYEVLEEPSTSTKQPSVSTFNPNTTTDTEELELPQYIDLRQTKQYTLDENGDPPLLIDLGIDPDNIKQKMKLILMLKKPNEQTLKNPDLSGPIAIALLLGFLLLFSGKLHFGDIYGVSILGTVIMYFLMNLMSERILIPVYDVMSVLGYALLPMCVLALITVFHRFTGVIGLGCSIVVAAWCAYSATMFLQEILHLHSKKWLIAYPVFLFYMTFVLITVF